MLRVYSNELLGVVANTDIEFDYKSFETRTCGYCPVVSHENGSTDILLLSSGIYLVTFHGVATNNSDHFAGVSFVLDGTTVEATETIVTASSTSKTLVSLSDAIKVNKSCTGSCRVPSIFNVRNLYVSDWENVALFITHVKNG